MTGEPRDKDFCLILFSFALAMYTVSVYTLVAVSLDRYVAICHPLYYETSVGTRETRRTVAICWCMGAIGLLPVFGWKDDHLSKEDEKCHPKDVLDFNFIIFMCVIVCFVPTIIITCTYLSMYKEIIIQVKYLRYFSSKYLFNYFSREYVPRWSIKILQKEKPLQVESWRQRKRFRWSLEALSYAGCLKPSHTSFSQ